MNLHYAIDLKHFEKDYVPVVLGLPYVKTLMKYFTKLYPTMKVSPFITFKEDADIVARSCMLREGDEPEIFFISKRIQGKEGQRERFEFYFLKKYFDEITDHIMETSQPSGKPN